MHIEQANKQTLQRIVAGTKEAVNMVEKVGQSASVREKEI